MTDRPARLPALVIDPPIDAHCIVHDPVRRKYFRLGVREATLLGQLDGSRAVADLESDFSPEQVAALLRWFGDQGLLVHDAPVPHETLSISRSRRFLDQAAHSDRWRVKLYDPDPLLNRHRHLVDALFGRAAMACYLLVILSPVLLFLAAPGHVLAAVHRYAAALPVAGWVALYLMVMGITASHEFAHALACKHFGGRTGHIGLMFMYLQPVVFCNVSDVWRFSNVRDKITVMSAGIFLQLVATGAALTAWELTGSPLLAHFAVVNTAIALFNLFPFIKLDGYWILVHLLGEPNLRHKGLAALDSVVRKMARLPGGRGEQRPELVAFGLAHAVVVPLFWTLGVIGIYRAGLWFAPVVGTVAAGIAAMLLVYRGATAGSSYARSLRLS